MSVDSQALERRTLEQKDRAELAAIVEAMGGKAGSRAKKADLVDQVLLLAGVGAPAAARPGDTDAPPAAAGNDEDKPSSAAEPTGAPVAHGTGEAATGSPSPVPAEPVAADIDRRPPPAADADGRPPPAADADGRPPPADDAERIPSGAGPVAHRQAPGDAPGGDGQAGEGEGSGRRRRRRGRNRDGQGQPQGQGPPQGQPQPQGQGGGQHGAGGEQAGGNGQSPQTAGGGQPDGAVPGPDAEPVAVAGYLDLRDEGYGFLRVKGYLPSKEDVYVSVKQGRQFGLRKGDHLTGASRMASRNEKNPALLRIDAVNGGDPDAARSRRSFEDLTPLFPDSRLRMEVADDPGNMTARIIDIIAPIGKGQRGLIVSPPKAGKTTVMKQIARAIERNHPDVHLIVLLVDERPEEVTDFRKWLKIGEVVASTFDRPAEEHTAVAELTIERAKRMVEDGRDVCIILDGITRLTRAYNLAAPATGKIMSGGIDAGALYPPKKFFGAARNIEEGGSLTIIASALVETNSRMDEHIFEELKGTGNMELKLDRRVAERRVYPAIDVDASSTRHEELLLPRNQLPQVWKLRRVLSGLAHDSGTSATGLELLLDRMRTFPTNAEFLAEIGRTAPG